MSRIIELSNERMEKISVVCPYYNEAEIIEHVVEKLVEKMCSLQYDYELILVNDGSTDNSFSFVQRVAEDYDKIVLVTYTPNEGRGYALRQGIAIATGDIIVTTEIDLSWGEDIIHRIVERFERNPYLDCVIASPNLLEGGYKDVPFKRVLVSKIGNILIRLFFVPKISMNTGMTRGYKRNVIQSINLTEKGKEFHLEVLLKLYNLNYRIDEIPAILQWKKFGKNNSKVKRKSSTMILKVIKTHLNFLFFSKPLKYFWVLSAVLLMLSLMSLVTGIYYLLNRIESLWMGMTSLLFAIFGILFFGFGVITEQNMSILKELWTKNNKRY